MDPAAISPWLALALSAIALATVVYGWFTAGEKKVAMDLAELKKAIADEEMTRADAINARFQLVESRVQGIEGELKHLPDGATAQRLEIAVERLNGQLAVLEERMKPIAAINTRLQEWALEQGK